MKCYWIEPIRCPCLYIDSNNIQCFRVTFQLPGNTKHSIIPNPTGIASLEPHLRSNNCLYGHFFRISQSTEKQCQGMSGSKQKSTAKQHNSPINDCASWCKSTLSNLSGWASPMSLPSNADTLIAFITGCGMKDSNVCFSHLNLRLSYSLQWR